MKLFYLWYFKPGEKQTLPFGAMTSNMKFFTDVEVIDPQKAEVVLKECEKIFSNLKRLYLLIPDQYWVIKTDLMRILVVYLYGGYYSDIDCFIKQLPLEVKMNVANNNDIENNTAVADSYGGADLFIEHVVSSASKLGPRECRDSANLVRVANFFFGSKKQKHPFFAECINECLRRLEQLFVTEHKTHLNHSDVLWVCGPDVITTVYHRSAKQFGDVRLFSRDYLNHKCFSSWRN